MKNKNLTKIERYKISKGLSETIVYIEKSANQNQKNIYYLKKIKGELLRVHLDP